MLTVVVLRNYFMKCYLNGQSVMGTKMLKEFSSGHIPKLYFNCLGKQNTENTLVVRYSVDFWNLKNLQNKYQSDENDESDESDETELVDIKTIYSKVIISKENEEKLQQENKHLKSMLEKLQEKYRDIITENSYLKNFIKRNEELKKRQKFEKLTEE